MKAYRRVLHFPFETSKGGILAPGERPTGARIASMV
jgi:hypothetical protein